MFWLWNYSLWSNLETFRYNANLSITDAVIDTVKSVTRKLDIESMQHRFIVNYELPAKFIITNLHITYMKYYCWARCYSIQEFRVKIIFYFKHGFFKNTSFQSSLTGWNILNISIRDSKSSIRNIYIAFYKALFEYYMKFFQHQKD